MKLINVTNCKIWQYDEITLNENTIVFKSNLEQLSKTLPLGKLPEDLSDLNFDKGELRAPVEITLSDRKVYTISRCRFYYVESERKFHFKFDIYSKRRLEQKEIQAMIRVAEREIKSARVAFQTPVVSYGCLDLLKSWDIKRIVGTVTHRKNSVTPPYGFRFIEKRSLKRLSNELGKTVKAVKRSAIDMRIRNIGKSINESIS